MRLKGYTLVFVGAISLCLLVGWNVKGQAPSFTSVVYEYKVMRLGGSDGEAEKRLNELGMQQWELVAVQLEVGSSRTAYYLRRQIKTVTKG